MSREKMSTYLYAAFSIAAWSTVATAFKLSLKIISPFQLVLVSGLTSFFIFFLIIIVSGKFKLLKNINKKDVYLSMIMGMINPLFYYLILFKGYSLLPAQIAQPLNMTWGIVIALMSVPILKQKILPGNIFALLISFFGVIVLSTRGDLLNFKIEQPEGILLIISTAFIWSIYWLLNAKDKKDPIVTMFLNFLFGSIYLVIFMFLFTDLMPIPLKGMAGGIYSGVFEMGITYYMWLKAMKSAKKTANISILIYIVPFISLVFIAIFLKEKILISSVIGLLFLIGGILLNQKIIRKHD